MSTYVFKSLKDPGETITVTFDVTRLLASGEAVATAAMSVTDDSGKDTDATAILLGDPIISGSKVAQFVTGGVNGGDYHFRCTVTTSNALVYVSSAILRVRSA